MQTASNAGRLRVLCLLTLVGLSGWLTLSAAAVVPLTLEARPGPHGSVQIELGGNWTHGNQPFLDRIEIEDRTINLYLVTVIGGGPAFVTPWQIDTQVDGLLWSDYTVRVYYRENLHSSFPGELMASQAVHLVRGGICHGEFIREEDLLCAQNGRFQIRAWYRLPGQEELPAHPIAMSLESGAFWFFRPGNVEVLVKVLDGCDAFDHFWVFAGGVTDLGVRIEVLDHWTGETWEHVSPPGSGFEEVRDTQAFATCDATNPQPPWQDPNVEGP